MDDLIGIVEVREDSRRVEHLQRMLKRYCLSLTESPWDADDLAQDTWLRAINALGSLGHPNMEAYLLRIARNAWIDQTRRNTKLTQILKAEQPKIDRPDNGNLEIESIFHALIEKLPPLQRAVFILRDVLGYSIAETAAKLETTHGAVKAALHRARQSLPTIKDDIEQGLLPQPSDEELKIFLRILAAAYRMGDVTTLIQLVQQHALEPAMAIGWLHNKQIYSALGTSDKFSVPTMHNMAA